MWYSFLYNKFYLVIIRKGWSNPKKKSLWLKILDAGISIFGYVTGLIVDILDIIYNPFILRKVAASLEIVFSTVSLGIHIYTLIKY